ncbi:hypothetical protein EV193_102509 [Herbihabitans rhizosphaerae]|uniref:Protein phosphatase 2C-like protein n=1 Tax=Herbihabitans rhizosphaerae TaxID=1872711 RepID=A0A4Q7L1X8_9PSEU|nr:hypothetical protein [Herbihabitans rhizosphaerae]RZS43529.1 hypothetical protein EV193_102509 [Herbihabitans rhizosphaerae]
MRIDIATVPGDPRRPNEDFVAVAGEVVVVLDGVTPPPDGVTGCVHDVPWFVARLGASAVERASTGPRSDLAECLAGAIETTAAAHRDTCDLAHPRTPQATVAMLRWDADLVEHLVLSDAAVLLDGPAVTPILDTTLTDVLARDDVRAAHGRVYRELIEGLRNVDGGFFTAAADPAVVARAITGSTPRSEVHGAAALTDGVTRWVEAFGAGDWSGLCEQLGKRGCSAVIDEIRRYEAADPDGVRYPRGKRHDDATAVYVDFDS